MLSVGLIGIGAIGRLHFDCWRKSPHARVGAIVSRDPRKRAGDWSGGEFNLGTQAAERVDLTGIAAYETPEDLFADPSIDIVDICSPTPHHAPLIIAALRAGKHVVCEKPMALSVASCAAVEEASRAADRQLMIAHCLRYWPHYVRAKEILASGEFGRALYARFERAGGTPAWSAGGWLMDSQQSGGVLDMYIHDIDVALWWFGKPMAQRANGLVREGVPLMVDSRWTYPDGPEVQIHGAWDPNGGSFRHAFRLVMERATLAYDLATGPASLQLWQEGAMTELPMDEPAAHQAELDDFASCIAEGRAFTRFTPADSRLAVEMGLEELRQIGVQIE